METLLKGRCDRSTVQNYCRAVSARVQCIQERAPVCLTACLIGAHRAVAPCVSPLRAHRTLRSAAHTMLKIFSIGPVPGRHSAMTVWSPTKTVLHPRTQRSFTHRMVRLDQTAPWRSETGLGKLLTPNEAYSSSGRTQWTGGSSLQKTRIGDSNSNAPEK